MPAPFISGVGQRGQVMRSGTVESGQGVRAGGGEVVYRAGLGFRDPQREPVRGEDGLDVAAVGVRLAGVPQVKDLAFDADSRCFAPVAAGMVEAGHQFRRVNGHLHLPKLRAALDAHFTGNVTAVSQNEDQKAA